MGGHYVLPNFGNRAWRLDCRYWRSWIRRWGARVRNGLAVTAALYYWTDVSRVLLFWTAFILTRPLGATLGDFLDKPLDHGGLAMSRPIASAVLAAIMIICVLVAPKGRRSSQFSLIKRQPSPRAGNVTGAEDISKDVIHVVRREHDIGHGRVRGL